MMIDAFIVRLCDASAVNDRNCRARFHTADMNRR